MRNATIKKDIEAIIYCKNKISEVAKKRDRIIVLPAKYD
jgi:hypothetical protein